MMFAFTYIGDMINLTVACGIDCPVTESKWIGSQSNESWHLDLCYTLK